MYKLHENGLWEISKSIGLALGRQKHALSMQDVRCTWWELSAE